MLSQQAIELIYDDDHRHRRSLAEQAPTLANELGDPRTTARVLTDYLYVFWALAARGEAERATEHARRTLELSREHGYALFEPRAAALVGAQSPPEPDVALP